MPELLSPFAPVHDWLARALGIGWDGSRLAAPKFTVHFCEPPEREELDLRDGITRYAVLRAAYPYVNSVFPTLRWALGRPWCGLDDEPAGRIAAEVIRRLGPDPSKPRSRTPMSLLGVWTDSAGEPWSRLERYDHKPGSRVCIDLGEAGWEVRMGDGGRGPETGAAGRAAADAFAIAQGAIFVEQIYDDIPA